MSANGRACRLYRLLAMCGCLLPLALTAPAQTGDFASEPFIIESVKTHITMDDASLARTEFTMRVRLQSDAGVNAWGFVSAPFSADRQTASFDFVRVTRHDGSVVETPGSDAQDVSASPAGLATALTDLKNRKLAVRGLEPGSTLEYRAHIQDLAPETPGQFWLSLPLIRLGVVLNEQITLDVPAARYLAVSSPTLKPTIETVNGRKLYHWQTEHLQPLSQAKSPQTTSPQPNRAGVAALQPAIQATTFHSWDEVGQWYRSVYVPMAQVTPAIQAKADELTRGLSGREEKTRALYQFVSTRFRYTAILLGAGHYRPHAAAEVLTNGYGDCKDKETLLAALLKAEGIESWPALVPITAPLDPALPSPGQFQHLITVLPQADQLAWLDSTVEVMPYGMLAPQERRKQVLVVASGKPAFLAFTPGAPPAGSPGQRLEKLQLTSKMAADGTVDAHFDFTMGGDSELVMRTALRALGNPAQNDRFLPAFSKAIGLPGESSNLTIDPPGDTSKPLHYAFDYKQKGFAPAGYARLSITLPPLLASGPMTLTQKPEQPFPLGAPGLFLHQATITLPRGTSIAVPDRTVSSNAFADFEATYNCRDGVVTVERKLVIKQEEIAPADWDSWVKLRQLIASDHERSFPLVDGTAVTKAEPLEDPVLTSLVKQGFNSLRDRNAAAARDFLLQAQSKSPDGRGVWYLAGWLASTENRPEEAMDDFRKEIKLHGQNEPAYLDLARMQRQVGRDGEAFETLQLCIRNNGPHKVPVLQLAAVAGNSNQASAALDPLRQALKTTPDDYSLRSALLRTLMKSGHRDEGLEMARTIVKTPGERIMLRNNAAYELADAGTDLPLAKTAARQALDDLEAVMAKSKDIDSATQDDLLHVLNLAAVWDTYGWTCFETGDLACAERYVNAAWRLDESGTVGDHLGQIYLKQGKRSEALHSWELAYTADHRLNAVGERLKLAGIDVNKSHAEELSRIRTVPLPDLQCGSKAASAEFFLLLSPAGQIESKFISGDESLRNILAETKSIPAGLPWPDSGPERLLRRGILSCSALTKPACQFTYFLPQNTRR